MNRTRLWMTVVLVLLCAGLAFGQDVRDVKEQAAADASGGPQSALATGFGKLLNAKFLSETVSLDNANDQVWVNAFNTNVTLTGTAAQCIKLSYAGEMKILTSDLPPYSALLRAVIDNVTVNGSGKFVMLPINNEFSLVSMNWWKCGLAAGTHSVKVQFLPDFPGDVARVGHRTLVIEYSQ